MPGAGHAKLWCRGGEAACGHASCASVLSFSCDRPTYDLTPHPHIISRSAAVPSAKHLLTIAVGIDKA